MNTFTGILRVICIVHDMFGVDVVVREMPV